MISVYISKKVSNIPYIEILYQNFVNQDRSSLFDNRQTGLFTTKLVEITEKPEEADYFLLCHNYNYIKNDHEYLKSFLNLANNYSKKTIIFSPGDSDNEIKFDNIIIFRNSQYKYKRKNNEIIMPSYSKDLSIVSKIIYREKGDIPIVGFCGWIKYRTTREWVSYFLYNIRYIKTPIHKKGLYFRRKAIRILKNSKDIVLNIITRSSYSGNLKTISLDPVLALDEYIKNIKESDFTLSVKGDGNFSARFYEVLSLGRIPVLIDTDCVLPMEDKIDYSKFILRVDYKNIGNLSEIIRNFYDNLTPAEFTQMQKSARETYENNLKIDFFLKYCFEKDNLKKYENVI